MYVLLTIIFCIIERLTVTSLDSLFDWTTRDLRLLSSYSCLANATLGKFKGSSGDQLIEVSLSVSQLQAQAFQFSSETGFDEGTYIHVHMYVGVKYVVTDLLTVSNSFKV